MRFVTVARCADVPANESRVFDLGGIPVAIFNAGGAYYACKNVCPHRGGPVGEGDFDGRVVTCPWHGWQFDVTTGANVLMPAAKVDTFAVRVEDDQIQVGIE
jgi:nitrite reductase/ring-hydroxylating ferredoxin subunit